MLSFSGPGLNARHRRQNHRSPPGHRHSSFPSAAHFASCAGRDPGARQSGTPVHGELAPRGGNPAAQTGDVPLRFRRPPRSRSRGESLGEDLLSALVHTVDEGGNRLAEDELISLAFLLLVAGHETTVYRIGNAMRAPGAARRRPESTAGYSKHFVGPTAALNSDLEVRRPSSPAPESPRTPRGASSEGRRLPTAGSNLGVLTQSQNHALHSSARPQASALPS